MAKDHFVTLSSGCTICYQVFGAATDSAILLIAGHSMAMTQKSDSLISLLNTAEDPHYVIRFDHRDTGLSSSFKKPPENPDAILYTFDDMVDDIVGLIQHLELNQVHLVGSSMGGTLAWQVASRIPATIRSLTLALTSPVGRQQLPSDNLPPLHLEARWLLAEAYEYPENAEDDEGWIEMYARIALCLATEPPTEAEKAEARQQAEITYRREKASGNMWTKHNHSDASGPRWPRELLLQIKCPAVIIHGAKDQVFPRQHSEALRDDIEGAKLVVWEDCGHEMPHRVLPRLAEVILANVGAGIEQSN